MMMTLMTSQLGKLDLMPCRIPKKSSQKDPMNKYIYKL